jgi:hypothetical protein
VLMTADRLVSLGLVDAGYTYLNIDGEGGRKVCVNSLFAFGSVCGRQGGLPQYDLGPHKCTAHGPHCNTSATEGPH